MIFVYFLQTEAVPRQYYRGLTRHADPQARLWEHNQNQCLSTAHKGPWELVAYVAFSQEKAAIAFEKYVKHGSGHAFSNKHFYNIPSTQPQKNREYIKEAKKISQNQLNQTGIEENKKPALRSLGEAGPESSFSRGGESNKEPVLRSFSEAEPKSEAGPK